MTAGLVQMTALPSRLLRFKPYIQLLAENGHKLSDAKPEHGTPLSAKAYKAGIISSDIGEYEP